MWPTHLEVWGRGKSKKGVRKEREGEWERKEEKEGSV